MEGRKDAAPTALIPLDRGILQAQILPDEIQQARNWQLNHRLGRINTQPRKIMFKKQDADFDEMAADPIRRRAKIADLSWRRTLTACCALVIIFAAVAEIWSGDKKAIGGVLAAAISWGAFIKYESDLRLLRIIERLHKPMA